MTISKFEIPVCFFSAYVVLDLMYRHIRSKEEVFEYQLGGIRESDNPLEVVRKYCNYKGVEHNYSIRFHMPSLEAAHLYTLLFGSDTVVVTVDDKSEEIYEF